MAEIFFFTALLVIGGRILYEDLKEKRIRNILLLLLIGAGFFLNYYTGVFSNHLLLFFTNICAAIAVALLIWLAGLWSAADAKLYISLVFLFPVIWFQNQIGYFPGFAILINSSVPLFFFLICQVLVQTSRQKKRAALKETIEPQSLINVLTVVVGATFVRGLVSVFFKINMNYFLSLIVFLVIFWLINKLKIKSVHFFAVIVVIVLMLYPHLINEQFLAITSVSFAAILFSMWVLFLSQSLFNDEVKISELKEGMILNEIVVQKDRQFVKRPLRFFSLLGSLVLRMNSRPVLGYNPDGLEKEDIEKIKEMSMTGRLEFATIKVAKTLPFAQALLLGVLLTYFLKNSFLAVI